MNSIAVNSTHSPSANAADKGIPVIGIVGGIGSGKSSVANWVGSRANVAVIDADKIGHEALLADHVKTALCERFGDSILASDGTIARSKLAQLVFGTESAQATARRDLESIVHPEIGRRIGTAIDVAAADGKECVLLDAAVMLEAGWRNYCDLLVFIETSDAVRLERVRTTRGWSASELQRREQSQWSLVDKRKAADAIVNNDADVGSAGQQLWDVLRQRNFISSQR